MQKVHEWFTNGKKVAVSICLVVISLIVFGMSSGSGTKGYIGFLIFASGIMGLFNALLSKLTKCNMDYILHLLVGVVIPTSVGITISNSTEGSILYGCLALIGVFIWGVDAFLFEKKGVLARILFGLVSLLITLFVVALGMFLIALVTMPTT